MPSQRSPNSALVRLLNAQSGVISREQALGVGMTTARINGLVAAGHWIRVEPGIYSAFGPPGGVAIAWAGVLIGGDESCVGGWAAAYLQGLTGQWPQRIETWTPRHLKDRPALVFRRGRRLHEGQPPRTVAAATIVDLAAEIGEDQLVTLLAEAAFKRITTPDAVRAELAGRGRHPARKILRTLLGDVAAGVMSPLERRYLRDVELAHGLPQGVRQARLGAPTDVLYPDFMVVIELDGSHWHGGGRAMRDRDLDHIRAAMGALTLRFTWADVATRPCEVAAQVAAVLRSRGFDGDGHGCWRCQKGKAS